MKTMTLKELMEMRMPIVPEPLAPETIAELERLSALCDPGPWKAVMDLIGVGDSYGPEDGVQFGGEQDFGGMGFDFSATPYDKAATVRLICAMRNALPALLEAAKKAVG